MNRLLGARMGAPLAATLTIAVFLFGTAPRTSAQAAPVALDITLQQVTAGSTGTATARFNRIFSCAAVFGTVVQGGLACIDPTTGLPIAFTTGSILNGNVVFTISNPEIATWVNAQPNTSQPAPSATGGFVATASQVVVRCGFFPTTGAPATGVPGTTGPINNFFGGCDSASAQYRGLRPGVTQITATFVPDLPGAFGSGVAGLSPSIAALLGLFQGSGNPSVTRTLEVVAAPASGTVQLARGCNNVSPTVSESTTAYAARVTPQAALVAIWQHQAATNTFNGFSPQPAAPNDLASVTRLRPVFVCVTGPASLDQPAA
ncbi:MAG: hypothetical protein HYX51_10455 [Chloroflexi bacterium]|nr:hypothetical protein [Chloroflexota bacterium]